MFKFLYLIRHAKSSWKDISLDDFDRPLNKRGKNDAPFMGDILCKKDQFPELIISSDAKRAKSTAIAIKDKINYNKDIIFNNKLYEASVNDIYTVISSICDDINSVFLISHNPSLNMIAYDLVNFNNNIPTTGIVKIKSKCKSWKDINKNNSSLVFFDYPKAHK